jgi:hypothetical protein
VGLLKKASVPWCQLYDTIYNACPSACVSLKLIIVGENAHVEEFPWTDVTKDLFILLICSLDHFFLKNWALIS